MTTSNPSYLPTTECLACHKVVASSKISESLCLDCFLKFPAFKSSARLAMMSKQPESPQSEPQVGKPGVKDDKSKPRYDLLPFKALDGLVSVLTFGANKYAPNGWRTVPEAKERYLAALLRHLSARQQGELVDKESGLPHIYHILCNAAFLAELEEV